MLCQYPTLFSMVLVRGVGVAVKEKCWTGGSSPIFMLIDPVGDVPCDSVWIVRMCMRVEVTTMVPE